MTLTSKTLNRRTHFSETLHLAWPLIITQVGHIVTGMVDNIFLGRLGVKELGAGILSNNVFVLLLVFSMGMSFGLTPLVSDAVAKNDGQRKCSLFKNALLINVLVGLACFVILFQLSSMLSLMRQPPEVTELAVPFFNVLAFSILPLSLFFTGKQYCEGLGNTRLALLISITGNLLNVLLNYLLIYGKWGMPELGYMGAAWASFWARMFMGVAFMVLLFNSSLTPEIRRFFSNVRLRVTELRQLWKLGFNSALQFTFEVATFVIAALMAGTFGEIDLDAHGIAISLAGFTYMFGNGISGAATIRVSAARARNDWQGVRSAARAALLLVLIVMGSFALIFLIWNKALPAVFSTHGQIIQLASSLLIIAALFQLFDGLQVAAIGILRGLEDVRISTLVTFSGYWVFALPLAYLLAFKSELRTIGIWIALLASLVFVAAGLLWRLQYLLKRHPVSLPNSP